MHSDTGVMTAFLTRPLPEVIYNQIKEAILTGLHPPGAVLKQEDMAQRYGASRVPVREAFSRLEAEGFLTLRPRRGYAVLSFDVDEIIEIFDLRMIVEEQAGRLAALARTKTDAMAVNDLVTLMESLDPAEKDYFSAWCEINRKFHQRIVETTRRRHLIKFALQLRDIVEPYIRLEVSATGHLEEANMDHRAIAQAFATGDADLVARLSRDHCRRTADRLINALQKAPDKFGLNSNTRERSK
jgi:DNA-binding GntR family transcriptional regulator